MVLFVSIPRPRERLSRVRRRPSTTPPALLTDTRLNKQTQMRHKTQQPITASVQPQNFEGNANHSRPASLRQQVFRRWKERDGLGRLLGPRLTKCACIYGIDLGGPAQGRGSAGGVCASVVPPSTFTHSPPVTSQRLLHGGDGGQVTCANTYSNFINAHRHYEAPPALTLSLITCSLA